MGEEIDGRADEYALAATAYHLLTGSQLFPHSNPAVVISRHLNSPPPKLAATRPDLAALDPVLAAALAKDPADRFPRCSDFARALAEQCAIAGAPPSAAPTTPAPTPRRSASTRQPPAQRPAGEGATADRSRRKWVAPLTAAAVIALLAAIALVWRPWEHHPSTPSVASTSPLPPPVPSPSNRPQPFPSPPSKPAVFPASAIDTLLLSPTQIRTITDGEFYGIAPGSDMVVSNSSYGMSDSANQVDPPSCVGIIFGADHSVYSGTGFDEIRDQTLDPSSYTVGNQVEQTAVVFPSAQEAQAVLTVQTKQWQICADLPSSVPGTPGLQMGQRHGEGGLAWTLANVVTGDNLITVKMAGYDNEAGSHQACQQALGVRANVVVKTKACREMIQTTTTNPIFTNTSAAGDYAERMANAMLEKVKV